MNLKWRYYLFFLVGMSFAACQTNGSGKEQDEKDTVETSEMESIENTRNIIFFGNSLTAGLGLASQDLAFPALIQKKIDSLGLPYQCINAGVSGETSAGGRERVDWIVKQDMDIFVLELGANDGLRGIPTETTFDNLSAIVEKVLAAHPDCKLVLAGMKVPPSMGQQYFRDFENIFPRLAEKYQMTLIPFLLDRVAGVERMNQSDRVHPTAEGQVIMAEHVWQALEPLLD